MFGANAQSRRQGGNPRAAREGPGSARCLKERRRYTRSQRLGKHEIAALLLNGRKLRGRRVLVQVCPNAVGYARLGLTTSKRYVPLAVGRNCIKRLVREWFRICQGRLGAVDLLVRLMAPAAPADVAQELNALFPGCR
ncbi:MAG: ribonuclease P protein component [Betaproteobacteria bacterium]|nr:ribonuclease P protein component [Betaproteobacteria bacterium]